MKKICNFKVILSTVLARCCIISANDDKVAQYSQTLRVYRRVIKSIRLKQQARQHIIAVHSNSNDD